jgi:hypothetical protein
VDRVISSPHTKDKPLDMAQVLKTLQKLDFRVQGAILLIISSLL